MDNLTFYVACFAKGGKNNPTAILDGMISTELADQEPLVMHAIQTALDIEVERDPSLGRANAGLLGRPSPEKMTLSVYYTVIETRHRWYHRWVPFTRACALRAQQGALGGRLRDAVDEALNNLEEQYA